MRQEIAHILSLRVIPAGTFLLGSPDDEAGRDPCEGPQQEVSVEGFAMSATVVTNRCWQPYAAATGATLPPSAVPGWSPDRPELPLVGLSLPEVFAFCDWAGVRLPTEIEWEYACRAGTTTRYWSGNDEEDLARVGWYGGNSPGMLLPAVGAKPPNPWGLHDMHGGVWEWCAAPFTSAGYSSPMSAGAPAPGERQNLLGDPVVIRGGAWAYSPRVARSACRTYTHPNKRNSFAGFRCVVDT